jgi:hypothetical protein
VSDAMVGLVVGEGSAPSLTPPAHAPESATDRVSSLCVAAAASSFSISSGDTGRQPPASGATVASHSGETRARMSITGSPSPTTTGAAPLSKPIVMGPAEASGRATMRAARASGDPPKVKSRPGTWVRRQECDWKLSTGLAVMRVSGKQRACAQDVTLVRAVSREGVRGGPVRNAVFIVY